MLNGSINANQPLMPIMAEGKIKGEKANEEIDNKNLLREGSFPFITNALVFLSSLLIQYRNRIFVNVDTNPTTQGF